MNLLEHYIEEIHSVEEVRTDTLILQKVDLTHQCYGVVQRETKTFLNSEWEDVKAKGYFMA